jgi:hypothetical protein
MVSSKGHVDSDVELALKQRDAVVAEALKHDRECHNDLGFVRAHEAMRRNRIYVWEPDAMDAFWRFWENRTNLKTFMNAYMRSDGLVYQESMIGDEFHFFPAPGRLFAEDTLPKNFVDPIGSIIFPPTTRVIGTTTCTVAGKRFIPGVLQSVHVDPNKLLPTDRGMARLERMTSLPPFGTPESARLRVTYETRFPKIVDGMIVDRKPIQWLICLYQLQIFLVQPFIGHTRTRHGQPKSGKRMDHPAPEIVQVLMREPLPVVIPKYTFPTYHPVTGRKLEFEVDVRSHERHCASGVVTTVKAHKRGPVGHSREKVVKVIR